MQHWALLEVRNEDMYNIDIYLIVYQWKQE